MSKDAKKAGKGAPAKAANLNDIPKPKFWADRVALFDKLYAEQLAEYEAKKAPIKVTLPDGKVMEAESWVSSPIDIARKLSNSLPDKMFVARVNDELWDLTRPFEGDCTLELLDWDEPESKKVFWHSSAHVMGYAMERILDTKLSTGPPLEEGGFFYEGETNRNVTESDFPTIEAAMQELTKKKLPYQRLVLSKENIMKMFGYNQFKQRTLGGKVPDGAMCTAYKCGELIDPCRGPHLPDTGRVKAIAVTKNSSSYFQSNSDNEALQRVYGITFPKEAMMKEWKLIMEEAAKRDHRVIGRQQDLFISHELSPGSAFFNPHGARIYNTLIEFQRKQYRKRGFEEVISPNMYNSKLWMVSGHWGKYKDNMFTTQCEKETFGLKPMNCPGHCLLFASKKRSYKELPIRWADFGVLHRNELSGALTGLTRVRRFQQDDAHIFCRMDQVKSEIEGALHFLQDVYTTLGFSFHLTLSTRPKEFLGKVETWDTAERYLAEALNIFCKIDTLDDPFKAGEKLTFNGSVEHVKKLKAIVKKEKKEGQIIWDLNPEDGAFYGPKIDIKVEDVLRRKHQLATIQLDFVLPERFGLHYVLAQAKTEEGAAAHVDPAAPAPAPAPAAEEPKKEEPKKEEPKKDEAKKDEAKKDADSKDKDKDLPEDVKVMKEFGFDKPLDPNQDRPVMIHRAIFGSVERCIAILSEHFGGKWPFWLSPRQLLVVPVSQTFMDFANDVRLQFHGEGFHCDVDSSNASLDKKIRNGQLAQYNFILVVGAEEVETKSVNVRTRDNARHGTKTIEEMMDWCTKLNRTYSRDY